MLLVEKECFMSDTEPEKPSGSFADYMERDPHKTKSALPNMPQLASDSGDHGGAPKRLELFADGVSIGWLGQDTDDWCVIATEDSAVSLVPYVYGESIYYLREAGPYAQLEVSATYENVGFYNGDIPVAWGYDASTGILTSFYTSARLSYWSIDDGYIYANGRSGYKPLTACFR
jgi:hypothetical protein